MRPYLSLQRLNSPVHFTYDMLEAWGFSWQVAQARDGLYEEGGGHWHVRVWSRVSRGHCFHQHPGAFWCHRHLNFPHTFEPSYPLSDIPLSGLSN